MTSGVAVVMPSVGHTLAASPNSAVVSKNSGCAMLDGHEGCVFTTQSQIVSPKSKNSKIPCRAEVSPSTKAKTKRSS